MCKLLSDKIRGILPEYYSSKRLSHILSVEATAVMIARYFFTQSEEKVYEELKIAALLHDITKRESAGYHQTLCLEEGYTLSSDDLLCPQALHAISSAYLGKKLFGINDSIFSAIRYHTTGRENMSMYDKIIFLADYIEPLREHLPCKKVREFFLGSMESAGSPDEKEKVLDSALLLAFDLTLYHLSEKNEFIHPMTINARNYIQRIYAPDTGKGNEQKQ